MAKDMELIVRSQKVATAIDATTLQTLYLPTEEVINRFDDLEQALLKQNFSEFELLEIRRRIAESKLKNIFNKDDSEQFYKVCKDLDSLGYSTLEREASMIFYRVKYFIYNDICSNSIIGLIDRLSCLTKKFEEQGESLLESHFKKVVKNLVAEINNKKKK